MSDGAKRAAEHVRRDVLVDPPLRSSAADSMTPRALDPWRSPEPWRSEARAITGYSRASESLREAVGEILVAARVGAGDTWLGLLYGEAVRHERQKDAAILGLLKLVELMAINPGMADAVRRSRYDHEDGCNCPPCFVRRYAHGVLNGEAEREPIPFERGLEGLRQSLLTPAEEERDGTFGSGVDT
jgi:hypothetical protein